jgi:hypothetical protein
LVELLPGERLVSDALVSEDGLEAVIAKRENIFSRCPVRSCLGEGDYTQTFTESCLYSTSNFIKPDTSCQAKTVRQKPFGWKPGKRETLQDVKLTRKKG